MKTLLTIISLLWGFCTFGQQSTIAVSVKNSKVNTIKVNEPLNGTYFWANYENYQLDSVKKCVISNKLKKAGIVEITIGGSTYKFFLEPRNSYAVNFDLANKTQPLEFTGADAAGQYLLNQIKLPFFPGDKEYEYVKRDSVFTHILANTYADLAQQLKPFDSLLAGKKISSPFFNAVTADIKYYYANVLATAMVEFGLDEFHRHAKPSIQQMAGIRAAWHRLYETFPLNGQDATSATWFSQYAQIYAERYLQQFVKGNTKGTEPRSSVIHVDAANVPQLKGTDNISRIEKTYKLLAENISGKNKEYALFQYMHQATSQQRYEPELITVYNSFKKSYPNSVYLPAIKVEIDKVVAYQQKLSTTFNAEQKIVSDYGSIASFDALLNSFKGKTVFVDLWATWCVPCKAEFAFKKGLEKFAKENNIEMLYVSMDKADRGAQWKGMIKYYGLAGNHVRTSDALRQDIMNKLWEGKGYAIPRYLIVKDGKIVNNDALRPSDKEKLYTQILESK